MKKCFISFFCLLLFATNLSAQDFHFSQFHLVPLQLSPALSGTGCGPRIVNAYRYQWSSVLNNNAFKTGVLSYDQAININSKDQIGLGINLLFDEAGQLDFRQVGGGLNIAYHKKLETGKTKNVLSFGLETAYYLKSINLEDVRWSSQYGGNGFDPTLPIGDNFNNKNDYLDFNLGLAWQSTFSNGNKLNGGFTVSHVNRPNQSFSEADTARSPLYREYRLFGQASSKLNPNLALIPRLLLSMQGPSFEAVGGCDLQYRFKGISRHTINMGISTRLVNEEITMLIISDNGVLTTSSSEATTLGLESIIFNLAYQHPKFSIGLSYDYNVSDLQVVSGGFGAIEMAMSYLFCEE